MPSRRTTRKGRRQVAMLNAYLQFYARRHPVEVREAGSWLYLLIWASLGGTSDEVIQ